MIFADSGKQILFINGDVITFRLRHRLSIEEAKMGAELGIVDYRFKNVDKATFRNGMSRLGSAVNITSTLFDGQPYGFTASAVCSVSDTPATLLVCINRSSSCFHAFENTRHFCINTLMPGQEDISNLFGGGAGIAMAERFANKAWNTGLTGVPVLTTAAVSFECELTNAVDEATHRILIGRVINIAENEKQGTLLYCMRRYLHG